MFLTSPQELRPTEQALSANSTQKALSPLRLCRAFAWLLTYAYSSLSGPDLLRCGTQSVELLDSFILNIGISSPALLLLVIPTPSGEYHQNV